MSHVTIDAPVKVNLHLGIHPGRDSRGYHRADSVMVALGVGDTVTVSTPPEPPAPALAPNAEPPAADASGVLLAMSEDVGVPPQKNTAWQAAARLRQAFGIAAPVRVEVRKAVPPQSGLGGSSSDAASVILALCRLFSLDEKDPRVVDVARSVGADVPFFTCSRRRFPCSRGCPWCWFGRGGACPPSRRIESSTRTPSFPRRPRPCWRRCAMVTPWPWRPRCTTTWRAPQRVLFQISCA